MAHQAQTGRGGLAIRRRLATCPTCWLALVIYGAFAQQTPPPAAQTPSGGPVTFSTTAQLVVEVVTVTDKSGKPVAGLSREDFQIFDNGVPQKIAVFVPVKPAPEDFAAPPPESQATTRDRSACASFC